MGMELGHCEWNLRIACAPSHVSWGMEVGGVSTEGTTGSQAILSWATLGHAKGNAFCSTSKVLWGHAEPSSCLADALSPLCRYCSWLQMPCPSCWGRLCCSLRGHSWHCLRGHVGFPRPLSLSTLSALACALQGTCDFHPHLAHGL